jgi:hypothetical protein
VKLCTQRIYIASPLAAARVNAPPRDRLAVALPQRPGHRHHQGPAERRGEAERQRVRHSGFTSSCGAVPPSRTARLPPPRPRLLRRRAAHRLPQARHSQLLAHEQGKKFSARESRPGSGKTMTCTGDCSLASRLRSPKIPSYKNGKVLAVF